MGNRGRTCAVWALLAAGLVPLSGALAQPVFPEAANVPGPSAALSAAPPYTCVTNRYVDAVRGNDANPGTEALPWKTIGNASNGYPNRTVPGECVNVLPGIYPIARSLILGGDKSGGNANTPTGYVVYRSTVPGAAHILAADGINKDGDGDLITLYGGYIVIDGFEIDGGGRNTVGHAVNGCAGGGRPAAIAHHVMAFNNIIHDVGGSGLSSCSADYILWRNNHVYNTSSTSKWQTSGLNVWMPKGLVDDGRLVTAWDSIRYRIEISYNLVHDTLEGEGIVPNQGCEPVAPAKMGPPCHHTDGNGIIIDTTMGGSTCPTCGTPYPGSILVLGNVAYNNGGSGIHVFLSRNVTVANNTAYNNNRDPLNSATVRGELSNMGSANVTWINNIAIAITGKGPLATNQPMVSIPINGGFQATGRWVRNILQGGPGGLPEDVHGNGNLVGVDPLLRDVANGVFTPRPGSPALGRGQPMDFLKRTSPNIGAF
jgi:parallel beta-helix repeat protein